MRQTRVFLSTISCFFVLGGCGSGEQKSTDTDAAVGEALTVSGISPERGPLAGGTTITISGENLSDMTGMVLIGDLAATDVSVVDDTTITAVTPPGLQQGISNDITVFSATGYGTLGDAFSYNPLPTIESIAPRVGDVGELLTISGTGFQVNEAGDTTVKVGDFECANVEVISDTEITCNAEDGERDFFQNEILVSNANGEVSSEGFGFRTPGLFVFGSRQSSPLTRTDVFFINPEAAVPVATKIGESSEQIHSIAKSPGGEYFARRMDGDVGLVRVDEATFNTTSVGTLASRMADLAFNGSDLIGMIRRQDNLVRIDTATGAQTLLPLGVAIEDIHGIAQVATNTLLLLGRRNAPVFQAVLNPDDTVTLTTLFTDVSPSSLRIRSATNYNGRIYAIREGALDAPPPPGGGGPLPTTLVEIDLDLATIKDVAAMPPQSHGIVRTN